MRFGVLGPLEVWTAGGTPVDIPESRVRFLLADLLVHEGRLASADRLVDDLWGDKPPRNPMGALQTKVSRLRRALEDAEPGGGGLVVSRTPGYLLRADADEVDMGRFSALTARAHAADDPRARTALLADALALWRGPAFADFGDDEFARLAIQRLEEQRLVALEAQAEARLELGEHSLLLVKLGDLVARHPLRERLRAVQLRALYRAGRQNEALAVYDEIREQLAVELGLDPGPELATLRQAILRQDPALDAVPVPAASVAAPRTNLPAPLTELVGRAEALAEVRSRLESGRLVTLTGPGGVGKTRLAMEAATRLADTFPDGVWIVELAGHGRASGPDTVHSSAEVAEAAAAALGIRDDATAGMRRAGRPVPAADRLADALRTRQLLLVLDNCEHVIEPVAELAGLLLRIAPGLRILATSRSSLGLAGEVLWTVPPLEEDSAVRLFAERAAAAAPGFTLNEDNAEAVAVICRRLDGIPLALELAAARMRALGVHELVVRLDDRFRLLTTGYRGAPPRQQALQAVIDWSWELLIESERAVLRRLAVHAESCTLEAAEEVCAGDGVDVTEILDLLAHLVDRSLVAVTDGFRYRLLESVAAYCVERLDEAGELERMRQRHYRYYTALAERADPHLRSHDQRQWLERLDADTTNLRSALDSAVRHGDAEHALRLVNALAWYWFLRGRYTEALRSLDRALAVEGEVSSASTAQAMTWRAGIALLAHDGAGKDPAARTRAVLTLYEQANDPAGRADAEWFLGFALYSAGGDLAASEDCVDSALATFRSLGSRWGMAAALSVRAGQALLRGDLAALERDGAESLALFEELGDRWGQLQTVYPLAARAEITGDYEQATRLHRDGLRLAEELMLWTDLADRLTGLGRITLLTGDHAQAGELHERARRLAAEQSYKAGEVHAEIGLALGARRQGEYDLAERHLRSALDWHRHMAFGPGPALILAELGFVAEQRGDAEAALALHREGLAAARATGDPRAVALALEGLAGAHALHGHHGHAATLLGAAGAARNSAGAPLPSAERGDVDRITRRVRATLGEEVFAADLARGTELDPLETVAGAFAPPAPSEAGSPPRRTSPPP